MSLYKSKLSKLPEKNHTATIKNKKTVFKLALLSSLCLLGTSSLAATQIKTPVKIDKNEVVDYPELDIDVVNPVYKEDYGLYISNGANVNIGNANISVTTTNDSANGGVYLEDNASLTVDRLNLNVSGIVGIKVNKNTTINLGTGSSIDAVNSRYAALYLTEHNVDFRAEQLTVSTDGGNALNVNADDSFVDLGSNSLLKGSGNNNATLGLLGERTTFKAKAITIIAEGVGNRTYAIDQRYGVVEIGAGSQIISKNGPGVLLARGGAGDTTPRLMTITGSSVSAGSQFAVSAQNLGSKLVLNQVDLSISAGGNAGYGMWALNGAEVEATDINIQAKTSGTTGIMSEQGGKVTLKGNITIEQVDPILGWAIVARGASSDNSGYVASVTGEGRMRIIGDVYSYHDAEIDLDMKAGSYWSGVGKAALATGAKTDIAMTESVWDMTGDSTLSSLSLNNSRVNFATLAGTPGARLVVNDLSGNGGLFTLRSDIISGVTDKVVVANSSQGSHRLTVLNQGSSATTGTELLTVVETTDGVADFALTNNVELGAYEYGLRRDENDQNHWQLYSLGQKSSTADAALSFINIGYLLDRAETQTLMQRMGDLRGNNSDGDVWLRGFSGNIDYSGSSEIAGFDMSYQGMQAGVDKRFSSGSGDIYVGTLLGMTNSTQDYSKGNGSVKGRHAGLYASYINESGFYLDATAKYTHMTSRFNVADTQGKSVHARAVTNGYALSTEVGQRLYLSQPKQGVYIEPQAQLTLAYQGGADFTASNGLATRLNSYHSVQGRVGTLLGYEVKKGRTPSNIYFKTGYVREFGGDIDYQLNDVTHQQRIKSNVWENGVGVNVEINRKHQLTLEMSNSSGDKFKQNQINAGYRFSF